MEQDVVVSGITKTFKLSKNQQKLNKSKNDTLIAVDNVSFSVERGEIFGLLGPNGAGKTTTLRMLSTLITPDTGNIMICGYNSKKQSQEIRERISFLTCDMRLEEFFTPNYLYDFYSDLYHIPKDVSVERKQQLFNAFGMNDFAEVKIENLSTGMKQKTALAISLLHQPQVLIFDEPTNGLDVITSRMVVEYLLKMKEKGHTIIISSHIFSMVEKICDRVGIIIDGRMQYCGKLVEICDGMNLEDRFFEIYYANEEKGAGNE